MEPEPPSLPVSPPPVPSGPPKPLRTARIIMWIQVAASALGCVAVVAQVAEIAQHGQELSGLGKLEVIEDPVVLVAAVIATIFVCSRRHWARPLAITVEAVAILNGLINIVSGAVLGVVGMGLAIAVLILLTRPENAAWLNNGNHEPVP